MIAEAAIFGGAFLLGWAAHALLQRNKRPEPPVEHETPPGTMDLSWGYTCHPERFFDQLERDVAVLDPDDRVRLRIRLEVVQGWNTSKGWSGTFGPIEGRADQVVEIAKALIMDDDSPIVRAKDSNNRQKDFLIRKWGSKTGLPLLSWVDSDSPLHITVYGTVQSLQAAQNAEVELEVEPQVEPEVEPERKAADVEVERLVKKHQATLRATHRTAKEG